MRADTTRGAGLTMVLVLSAACSAPTEGTGQTTNDNPQAFVQVPQGFEVSIFAEGLLGVRMLELGPDDRLYAALSSDGEVVRFDLNADGTAASGPAVVVSGLRQPYGLAFRNGDLYVGETHQVIRLTGPAFTRETIIVPGLPTGGHWTREIEFGPDGLLYVSVGSSCNLCEEGDARRAAVVRYTANGSGEENRSRDAAMPSSNPLATKISCTSVSASPSRTPRASATVSAGSPSCSIALSVRQVDDRWSSSGWRAMSMSTSARFRTGTNTVCRHHRGCPRTPGAVP